MKYEKLKQICDKERKYVRIGRWLLFPIMFAFMVCLVLILYIAICGNTPNEIFIIVMGTITVLSLIAGTICGRLEEKQITISEHYCIIKIMDTINEYGIASSDFEMLEIENNYYKVAFHNQMVDYNKLQSMIDNEVLAMNKITGRNMRVKLI